MSKKRTWLDQQRGAWVAERNTGGDERLRLSVDATSAVLSIDKPGGGTQCIALNEEELGWLVTQCRCALRDRLS